MIKSGVNSHSLPVKAQKKRRKDSQRTSEPILERKELNHIKGFTLCTSFTFLYSAPQRLSVYGMCILCCRSAGVGRTGVFITLSIVLERMRYEGAVDIFQTVKMLRTQRPAMVQTEVKGFLSLFPYKFFISVWFYLFAGSTLCHRSQLECGKQQIIPENTGGNCGRFVETNAAQDWDSL